MRYAESIFGEQPIAVGIFETGDVVTIEVFDISTPLAGPIALDDNACVEVQRAAPPHTGQFVWDSVNFTTQPTDFNQLSYIMTNGDGVEHQGKFVVGGYPSDSAIRRFGNAVHIDVANGNPGTAYPLGTPTNPVDNVTDARTIANAFGLTKYVVKGALTIVADHENWTFEGTDPLDDTVTVTGGTSVAGRGQFVQMGILGALTGRITAQDSLIGNGVASVVTGVEGLFNTCGINGRVVIPATGVFQAYELASQQLLLPGSIIDLNNEAGISVFLATKMTGNFAIRNAPAGHIIGISYDGGRLTLEATVASTNCQVYGDGEMTDNATSTIDDFLVRGSRVDVAMSTRATPAQVTSSVWGISEATLAAAGATGLLVAIAMSRNTQIDFTGDDLLGWQLVINDTAGSEIGRADLYDEANARIPSSMSVAAFIAAQKTISRVVPS